LLRNKLPRSNFTSSACHELPADFKL
jgi:hypothetical protein